MAKSKKKKILSRTKTKKKSRPDNGLDNTFRMVVLAFRRAKELLMGGKPLIETNNTDPCLIAIEEIRCGKVKYKEVKK